MPLNNHRWLGILVLILTGTVLLAGCLDPAAEQLPPTEESKAGGGELSREAVLELVIADLAAREGVAEEEIAVPSLKEVTWNDTSLGCSQEGEMYAQVLTPGYRITLAIGGPAEIEQFDYHADTQGNFVLCQ